MPARRITPPDAAPTPVEQRGEQLGIKFTRGRTHSSYSHLALEAAEFAMENAADPWAFHKRIFKAYFEDLEDIGDVDVLVRLADEIGLDGDALRQALSEGRYRDEINEGISWSRSIGVTAIPTFVFNERMGMVGAQELPAMREMMARVGNEPRANGAG
jgi:predicted DsbA family dithiol-disulfide isomerase